MTFSISVSNLAWTNKDDELAVELLKKYEISGLDIVAGRYFAEPWKADLSDWIRVANWWRSKGFEPIGLQSLLFGAKAVSLFDSREAREYLVRIFEAIFLRASTIGVKKLVFGSPKHRFIGGDKGVAWRIAADFFTELSLLASNRDVNLLIEPNSQRHGCNFLNTTKEAAEFVLFVDSSNLGINFDYGAEIDNPSFWQLDDPELSKIGHIHISNPDLTGLRTLSDNLKKTLEVLSKNGHKWWTLEQLGQGGEGDLSNLAGTLKILQKEGLVA